MLPIRSLRWALWTDLKSRILVKICFGVRTVTKSFIVLLLSVSLWMLAHWIKGSWVQVFLRKRKVTLMTSCLSEFALRENWLSLVPLAQGQKLLSGTLTIWASLLAPNLEEILELFHQLDFPRMENYSSAQINTMTQMFIVSMPAALNF